MKSKNYLLVVLALFFMQVQAQWSVVNSISKGNLYSVHFVNVDTGFTFHEFGTLRRTADGGQTWDSVPAPFTGFVFDYAFPTQSVGYAVGGAWFPFANYYSYSIMKTLDGGVTWDSVLADHSGGVFTSIHALSTTEYFATGEGIIIHSANGGLTHDTVYPAQGNYIRYGKVQFTTATTGYVSGGEYVAGGVYASYLYKTTDGGTSWQRVYNDTLKQGLQDFVATAAGEIILLGEKGYVIKSTNGGSSWQKLAMADTSQVLTKLELNDGKLYAIGTDPATKNSAILKSTDGGINWQVEIAQPNSLGAFADMRFPSAGTGYAVSSSQVYKNTKLISLGESGVPGGFKLYPNPANELVTIELSNAVSAAIFVYNTLGQRVMTLNPSGTKQVEVNVNSLRAGLYFIEVQSDGKRFVERLVKQ